jgi:hypothetical protein
MSMVIVILGNLLETRRTRPHYLSEGEALMESLRTKEMVDGFLKFKQIIRVGETKNFVVDFDSQEGIVIVYGKEIAELCAFKLAFDESETKAMTELLVKAKTHFRK